MRVRDQREGVPAAEWVLAAREYFEDPVTATMLDAESFHARRPMARLDRIMTSRDLTIHASGVHESLNSRTASDHLPIWAEIRPA